MKKITPKQRREIYLKVAEKIFNREGCNYLCGQLQDYIFKYLGFVALDDAAAMFPEFMLFEPKHIHMTWFSDKESRINCMLLCSEMTKSATE